MYRLIGLGKSPSQTREYIRHPAEIPIRLSTTNGHESHREISQNLSTGGLSCVSDRYMSPGSRVAISIDVCEPGYTVDGHIIWCLRSGDSYTLGIGFNDPDTAFSVRMIEQACHIECYRRQQIANGRALSADQAAHEWIERHAADFPWLNAQPQ